MARKYFSAIGVNPGIEVGQDERGRSHQNLTREDGRTGDSMSTRMYNIDHNIASGGDLAARS
jgi:hypothetical protein